MNNFKDVPTKTILMEQTLLEETTWDFNGADTKYLTHGIHTYPAMMIPQVAKRLIEENKENSKIALDPFCGSGSVLLEFGFAGLKSYGVDINPLATLISKTKNSVINPSELAKTFSNIKNSINKKSNVETPNFFNIDFWFKKTVIKKLAAIKKAIEKIDDEKIKNFFLTCFSETIRKTSNTRGGEFKLFRISKEKLDKYDPDVYLTFQTVVEKNIKAMSEFYLRVGKNYIEPTVILGNITQPVAIQKVPVDLVVTSPPYGDSNTTVAYGQFSRLSLQWLGFDEKLAKSMDRLMMGGSVPKTMERNLPSTTLINTLSKIIKKDKKRAREVFSFFNDFYDAANQINDLMSDKSTMCFVVGNRTVKETKIPTSEIIVDFFKEFNFKHTKTILRNIPNKRMPRVNSPTNKTGVLSSTMNQEHIVILKRD